MTNTQLLLLATNNIKNNTELSHSQESYVYQFYYENVANKFSTIKEFMHEFIALTKAALESEADFHALSSRIYAAIEEYLGIAQVRYIQRQKLLQK
ncbi:hypothetical protein QS795_006735 [Providencia zhijiangensis]|jgi:hypothetical protein|uniref:Uncharacterized protein n=1 Tax=Providencia zhijiangensis TaxID=3053982 RepID=A0ABZ0N561_9GAMM|nr:MULTISPECIES: hypothetical protein [Providencia]MTC72037.1 hypothetical protein [Providencia sp. wls1914]MTC76027.1 hypothetical protein [Providencia sp. wls1919]QLR06265.1 hypothetical protein H0913_08000 [Providencia rettgeri]WPA93454.1 hypothetical protein QS795_006735 [Providencia sp. D4759]